MILVISSARISMVVATPRSGPVHEPALHGPEPPPHGAVVALSRHAHEHAPDDLGVELRAQVHILAREPGQGLREGVALRPPRAPAPSPPAPPPLPGGRSTRGGRPPPPRAGDRRGRAPPAGRGGARATGWPWPSSTPPRTSARLRASGSSGSSNARRSSGDASRSSRETRSSAARVSADGGASPVNRPLLFGHLEKGARVAARHGAGGGLHAETSKAFGVMSLRPTSRVE